MSYTGCCACGSVTATITGEPLGIRLCYCRQCQQIAGGGATTNAVFRSADMVMTGKLGTHSFTAASGNTLTQYFCQKCATPIYGQSSARMHLRSIRLGFLDDAGDLKPDAIIWASEAPEWAVLDPTLDCYPQQAPMPPSFSEGS